MRRYAGCFFRLIEMLEWAVHDECRMDLIDDPIREGTMAFVAIELRDLRKSEGGPLPYWTVMNEVDGTDFPPDHRFSTEAEAVQMAKSMNTSNGSKKKARDFAPALTRRS